MSAPSKQFTATMKGMLRDSKKSRAPKESPSRRVSTRTTAPRAPTDNSFHMNQYLSWPGVPNRYSTICGLMVMRPKSRATVVVVLPATPVRSSMDAPISDSCSSVRSGLISLAAPTIVVLPAPNPPAISSLTACAPPRSAGAGLEFANAIEYRLQEVDVGPAGGRHRRPVDEVAGVDQVTDQDLDRSEQQVHVGGDLGDRQRPVLAQAQDVPVLPVEPGCRGLGVGGHDQGQNVKAVQVLAGAAAGHRERADQRPGIIVTEGRPAVHG